MQCPIWEGALGHCLRETSAVSNTVLYCMYARLMAAQVPEDAPSRMLECPPGFRTQKPKPTARSMPVNDGARGEKAIAASADD